jgi:hypothetical protein
MLSSDAFGVVGYIKQIQSDSRNNKRNFGLHQTILTTLKYLEGLVELELAAEACVSNADGKLWKCGYLRLPAFRQYLFGAVSICTPLHHCKPTRLQKKNFYARTTFKGSKSHLTFKKS